MKSLILTAWYGGPIEEKSPFLDSLTRVGYNGETRVLRPEWPIGHCERLLLYFEELKKLPFYDQVILTDYRDVLFQRDPRTIPFSWLDCYLEDSGSTIGSQEWNRDRVIEQYGEEGLAKIAHKPISCSGVIIGTQHGVLSYLDVFRQEVERRRPDPEYNQGIHNWIVHRNSIIGPALHENENSDVYHVGLCPYVRLSKGVFYNAAGEIPAIVHQYDRHVRIA